MRHRTSRTHAFHRYTPYTLADLFAKYDTDILTDQAVSTRYHMRRLAVRILADLGPMPLAQVTPEVLRGWKQRLSTRCNAASVRKYLIMLGGMFRVAVDDYGWLDMSPLEKVRKPPCPPGVVRFLTPEERVALLAACKASPHPSLYAIVLLALSTGGRKNEVRRLPWSAVDLARGVVHFHATKTALTRAVPLCGEALAVLQALAAARHPHVPWVFPDPKMPSRPIYVETAWRAARKASDVQSFRFHDLRHTFASYLAMSGASLRVIADLLGHKKIGQSMAYTHLMPSYTDAFVKAMHEKFLD